MYQAKEIMGKKILSVKLEEQEIIIGLEDNKKFILSDIGQSCCEKRYLSTDDDISALLGKKLTNVEVKYGGGRHEESDEVHEMAFLELRTEDDTYVTICAHNKHNGYYGGINLEISEIK